MEGRVVSGYGHNPFGAMFICPECSQACRTIERLREHEDSAECIERRIEQGQIMGGAS